MDFLLRPSLWNSAAKTHPSISCPPRRRAWRPFRLTVRCGRPYTWCFPHAAVPGRPSQGARSLPERGRKAMRQPTPSRGPLRVEPLEDRCLLTGGNVSVVVDHGDLVVTGDADDNVIQIFQTTQG